MSHPIRAHRILTVLRVMVLMLAGSLILGPRSDQATSAPRKALDSPRVRLASPFPGSPRIGVAGAYDPHRNRMYFHGGFEVSESGATDYLDELWAYDLDTDRWLRLPQAEHRPSVRAYHDLVIDATRRRLYLFGGIQRTQLNTCIGDLWSLSLDTHEWTLLSPGDDQFPVGLVDPLLSVEPTTGDVWVHFGGCGSSFIPSNCHRWSVSSGTWMSFAVSINDARERLRGFAAFDRTRNRVLITGGGAPGGLTDDGARLWRSVLSFDPTSGSWEKLTDGEQGPQMRGWMTGGFDDLSDLLVTYGGQQLWPSGGCTTCPGLSGLELFDMATRSWLSSEQSDPTMARVYAAGDHCRCTGELMVHAGSRHFDRRELDQFQSQAFFLEIEHTAQFRPLTPARHVGNPGRRLVGILELPDQAVDAVVDGRPMLIDCSTGDSLQAVTDFQPLGGLRYRVAFDELSAAARDAWSRDRLILVGRFAGDPRRFLARIRSESSVASTAAPAPAITVQMELGVLPQGAGFDLRLTGASGVGPVDFSIFDVRGRRVFRRAEAPGARGEVAVHWDGVDLRGKLAPQGVYFASARGSDKRAGTRFVLLRP